MPICRPGLENYYPIVSLSNGRELLCTPMKEWDREKVKDAIEEMLLGIDSQLSILDVGYFTGGCRILSANGAENF